jgi:hypothetical protein
MCLGYLEISPLLGRVDTKLTLELSIYVWVCIKPLR